jgi:hypothetical protein
MLKKQLLLFTANVLLLSGFFILPRNREWAKERIITYYQEFPYQTTHLDKETRMADRFETSYTLSKSIADELKRKIGNRNALVLMPPTGYFKSQGIDYPVPEPAVFYYYAGINTTGCLYKNAMDAKWYVRAEKGKLVLDSVIESKSLQDTITSFLKWNLPDE